MDATHIVLDSTDPRAWPYPAVSDARMAGRDYWRQISEELRWHFLEVLPPIYFPGGFMVSEPAAHTADGDPIYAAIVRAGNGYWMREVPSREAGVESARLHKLMHARLNGRPIAASGQREA